MFILTNSDGRFILLRCCECGETAVFERNQFKTLTPDYVILKDNQKITCEKCGTPQPDSDKFISLEPQFVSDNSQTVPESKLPFWATREITSEELMRTIIFD
ncbi:MAG: hypothetical protein E7508_07015 [Ruminococcus sp.]|nr:hypothetical protein [Ruminococcus sp.]